MNRHPWLVCAAVLALTACGGGEVAFAAPPAPGPSTADSVTIGLWHFDERSGPRAHDSGPSRLNGVAGPDARVEFGRFKSARSFAGGQQSFVVVPYNPVMESPRAFTVEAWVYLNGLSDRELSAIAMRWSPTPGEQSWVLGVVGQKGGATTASRLGGFSEAVAPFASGRLILAFRADRASNLQRACSSSTLPMRRWVHVAASVDGEVVRFYIDGRLDGQVVVANGIRPSVAPLVIGNMVDPRRLTDAHGELRQDPAGAPPTYALDGLVDELRLSKVARKTFESTGVR